MAFTTFTAGTKAKAAEVNDNFTNSRDELGEIKMFALSISGAVTKASLQARGWAICDGTSPSDQGVTSPTITTTPDLREKFLRHSATETTGGTGGSATHNHIWHSKPAGSDSQFKITGTTYSTFISKTYDVNGNQISIPSSSNYLIGDAYTSKVDTNPLYYDICYFIKVKII